MSGWNFGLGVDDQEEEYRRRLFGSIDPGLRKKIFGSGDWRGTSTENNEVYNSLWSAEKSRLLNKKQKLFDIAAEGGAQDGGTAVAGGGTTGIGYAPQRDITKTFPGSLSEKEEEERLALRARVGPAPGLFRLA